jgi:formylglycine-generating enzyme required for sulfatase activity
MGCVKAPCADSDEVPRHQVRFAHGFWLGSKPVTVAAYRYYSIVSGRHMPKESAEFDRAHGRYPIRAVSWSDARSFCSWAGGRLPSEAEWEYAARGGHDGMKYPWGDEKPISSYTARNGAGCDHPEPTGSFPANSFGLYDMIGNAGQWCEDAWYSYTGAPTDGSARSDENGTYHVVRGGSWSCLETSYRYLAQAPQDNIGFRCARDTPAAPSNSVVTPR